MKIKPSEKELDEMIKGKEPEIVMEFNFIEEKEGTVAIVHIKQGFIQGKKFEQFMMNLVGEVGNIVNFAILAEKGLLQRKEDVIRA